MLGGVRAGVRAGAIGVADQVLLSAGNLTAGLALARELQPADFGVYVIAFAVGLAAASVQLALVTDPLMVLGAPRTGPDQTRYLAGLLRVQLLVSGSVALVVGAIAAVMRATEVPAAAGPGATLSIALAGVALAIVPSQLQTFLRAVFFARLRAGAVLANDIIFTTLRLAALGALMSAGMLTPLNAILVAGAAALAAALIALPSCRDFVTARGSLSETWSAHWKYGRWLLATAGAFWCSGQMPTVMASSLLSPVAAAIIKACQYLVAPLNVAFNGLDGVLAPRASRIRAGRGNAALARFLRLFAICSGTGVALYALLVLPAAPWIMDFVYKGRYSGYVPIVAVLLLDALLSALGKASILRLKITADTRGIFVGYVWSAVTGLASLALLAPRWGVMGAAVAAPVSSGTLLIYLMATRPRSAGTREVAVAAAPAAMAEP